MSTVSPVEARIERDGALLRLRLARPKANLVDAAMIAALHGATLGGGLETAAAAHIRVADETTFFALPEGTRGIFIGGGGSVRVARLLGFARMQDMMLTGRVHKPDDAERVERTVLQVGEGVLGQDFEPRPSQAVCSWCDYRLICPAAES